MKTTPCQCKKEGWCERHKCEKSRSMFLTCQRRKGMFQLWEEGRGPGQQGALRVNPVIESPCKHQGDQLRVQECSSCRGNIKLKIFACEKHGECTLAKRLAEVACCRICEDYAVLESG